MQFSHWLRSAKSGSRRTPRGPARRKSRERRATRKLFLEQLEDRTLLSTYTVLNTLDSGAGSLRQALLDANASVNVPDTITFNIPTTDLGYASATGTFTIRPTAIPSSPVGFSPFPPTGLPGITDRVTINGYSQLGARPNTLGIGPDSPGHELGDGDNAVLKIELDGTKAGDAGMGLIISAPNCMVQGLVINRFRAYAIWVPSSSETTIAGNFIGTNVTGTVPLPNSTGPQYLGNTPNGAVVVSSANNLVGGTEAGSRNLISGNDADGIVIAASGTSGTVTGNRVQGNFIGTDVTGREPLGNGSNGVAALLFGLENTTIGGTSAAARNIIAASKGTRSGFFTGHGIAISAQGTVVQGNYIGTDVTGSKRLGNARNGVVINTSDNTTIGGTVPGAGNLISGNNGDGVGININVPSGIQVQGNLIGTDITGKAALGNSGSGVIVITGYPGTVIGGTTAGARNVISGNAVGIDLRRPGGVQVQGNFIGTDITGKAALGNGDGVYLADNASNNTIGGTTPAARNIISGNGGQGILMIGLGVMGNVVQGNFIGTDLTGTSAITNTGPGVVLVGSSGNRILANTIAFNAGTGVVIGSGTTNRIEANLIHSNGGLGIDLSADGVTLNDAGDGDTGANNLQNFPVLTGAQVTGGNLTVSGFARPGSVIEFFIAAPDPSGFGEGRASLATLTEGSAADSDSTTGTYGPGPVNGTVVGTDTTNRFRFTIPVPAGVVVNAVLTTTATLADSTSEFGNDVRVNFAPVVSAVTAPLDPVQVQTTINASANFTDADVLDTHTALWSWDDGTTSAGIVTESNGSGSVSGSHPYTAVGVYTVTLTVTDSGSPPASGQSPPFQYVVVYDSTAGFVTGGGWINSPAGAYPASPTLTGKANFGFVAKYQPGATVPSGSTEFQFHVANLNFQSTSYDWLVVAGARAQFKGTGTINGAGSYGFLLTAIDGQVNGGGGQDKFRIKITGPGGIVYDNQIGNSDTADPSTVLGGGSIIIHKDGGGSGEVGETGEDEPDPPTLTPPLLDALLAEATLSHRALGVEPASLSEPLSGSRLNADLSPSAIEPDALGFVGLDRKDAGPILLASARRWVSVQTALRDAVERLFAEDGSDRLDETLGAESLPVWAS